MRIDSMRSLAMLSLAGIPALLIGAQASAHHAFAAEFDAEKPVTLKGTVTRMEWINPHSWIHIDVVDDQGEIEEWMVEGGAPLKAGTVILVEGYQARDGSNRANGRDITFEDGTKLFVGAGSRGAPDGRE